MANIFTKCADVATDDCPLPHFPPRVSKLPPLPDDQTLSEITSSIPAAIPIDKDGHQNSSTAAVNNDQISAKCTSRLGRKRLAKKQRAEAELEGEQDQPPCWPFNALPPAACPRSGGRLSGRRARKKEGQLSSMIRCVLAMLPEDVLVQHWNTKGTRAYITKSASLISLQVAVISACPWPCSYQGVKWSLWISRNAV